TMSPNVTVTTSIHAKTVLPGLMASILLQLIVRCAPGSARENSALRHRSGQPGLRVLEIAILTREHRRVSRRPLRGKALDERVVVRLIDKRDRGAWALRAVTQRRVLHAVQLGMPL